MISTKTYPSKYYLFLGLITLTIFCSQFFLQKAIKESKSDATIVNISGRQRMLSQKISKLTLKMKLASSEEETQKHLQELGEAFHLWSSSHYDLKRGFGLNDKEMTHNPQIIELFERLNPYFLEIEKGVSNILASKAGDSGHSLNFWNDDAKRILDNEEVYLELMNEITFYFDELATAKIELLSKIEFLLLFITISLIGLEVYLIFWPMLDATKNQAAIIKELNAMIGNYDQKEGKMTLREANIEVKKYLKLAIRLKEELIFSQVELAENQEPKNELRTANLIGYQIKEFRALRKKLKELGVKGVIQN